MAARFICASCGAPVPAGRIGCGRCGSRENAKIVESTVRPVRSGFVIVGSAAVGVIAIGIGVALFSGKGPVAAAASVPTAVSAKRPMAVETEQHDVASEAPGFAAADASREAIAAYNGGDLTAAIAQFKTAVDADPSNAAALNNLGQVLVRSGRSREAIPYFDRAIAAAGDVWAYHFNRARAFAELKEWRSATAGYTDAVRLFPDDYVTHFNLAKAQQADGELAAAVQSYARAAELAPDQPDFHLAYGKALEESGRAGDAAAEYRKFLELQPSAPEAEKVKARVLTLTSRGPRI